MPRVARLVLLAKSSKQLRLTMTTPLCVTQSDQRGGPSCGRPMGSCACKAGAVARLVGGRCGGEFVSCDAKPPRLFLVAHAVHVEPRRSWGSVRLASLGGFPVRTDPPISSCESRRNVLGDHTRFWDVSPHVVDIARHTARDKSHATARSWNPC